MLHVRGSYALMVDADGATDITCLEKLFERTKQVSMRIIVRCHLPGLLFIKFPERGADP